ncbi:MFS transporter, partial [Georgenia sp. 10Sc9-8]|nr:MFS transporter [Georgenia halotolerans]
MVPAAGAHVGGPMFPLRTVVLGALVPSLLFGTGVGIALPLIPLSATRLGGDLTVAAAVAALLPVGRILTDLPAGTLATRIGDRRAMLVASVVALVAFAGVGLAPALWLLALSVLALGAASAVFYLARHS